MAKLDITTHVRGIDRFLATLENPLHRRIIENYRRHAIFEMTGQKDRIFTDDMTVEHPVYYISAGGESVTLEGQDQVRSFYSSLEEREATVMVVEDELLAVADWGFCSEAIFSSFLPGPMVPPIAGEVDPDKLYMLRQRIAMFWMYDERARLMGEHVYEHADHRELVEISEEEFITPAEAREKLIPLLRPLPVFEPVAV